MKPTPYQYTVRGYLEKKKKVKNSGNSCLIHTGKMDNSVQCVAQQTKGPASVPSMGSLARASPAQVTDSTVLQAVGSLGMLPPQLVPRGKGLAGPVHLLWSWPAPRPVFSFQRYPGPCFCMGPAWTHVNV